MQTIDEEVSKTLRDAAQRAFDLLKDKREQLETLTKELIVEEELDRKQIEGLIGAGAHSNSRDGKEARIVEPDSPPVEAKTNNDQDSA